MVGLFVLGLVAYGSYEATQLPIDAVPDITDNQVQIITSSPSLGATDIERLITFPVEQANSNIPGLKEIRSFSRFGLSLVTIVFDDATDVYWARQQVAERLQRIQNEIPSEIGVPEIGPVTTGLGEIYQYVIRPAKGFEQQYDQTELRTIQDWIVRRQLLGVKGVAEISSFGGQLKQYEVALDPARLHSAGLSIEDVFKALEQNNQNTGGAYIEKGPTVLYIRSEGLIKNKSDIENIVVTASSNGNPIQIRNIAEVKLGYATRYGAMTFNDQGEVAGGVVMMLKGANSSDVIKNVKERIVQIEKTLPEGVVIEAFLDRTKMVSNAIHTVEKNLMEGALIVVFVLVFFLGNFRAGLIVASVIPLSMLFAVIMMNTFGVSGNLMSLGALDFGLIVDGAVIIVEAVLHQLSHHHKIQGIGNLSQKEMDEEVQSSSGKMMNSAVFGQMIILIVYLPIFTLEGIEGKMFKPMAQTVAFALLGAFLLSLTYIPVMSSLFLSKKLKTSSNFSDRLMMKITHRYSILLQRILGFPKTVVTSVLVLFAIAIFILTQMGGEFIPALEEGDFAVDTRVLTGSNINTTVEQTCKAAKILIERFPEVEKVVSKIGSGEVPTDPMPMEASDMMVILKDKSEWTSAKTFNELSTKMSEALAEIPGITTGFQYPVQMRFNELMTGARQDVVCKIFGEDLDTLAKYAHQLGKLIPKIEGAKDLYVETVTGLPQVVITYDRALLAQYGVDIQSANQIVNAALAGQVSGKVYEGEKRFDLLVRLDSSKRKNLEDIQQLLIPISSGHYLPLQQMATVEIKDGPNQIQREDAKRRIIIGFNVRGRDVQSIVEELRQKVEVEINFPAGYYVTYGGAFENLEAARNRLMIAVPVSLLLILLLLYFAFNSIRQGLLIYSAIPLSAIGGIFFLALRGLPFSISAGIGFIALFGVAVLNGIVLIAEFNRIRNEGETDLRKIVLKGTSLRLRPVLMTAFVASLGFLPMALSNGSGAEVQRPLATVVIGGLMIATLLTLFVLPVLYMIFEKNEKLNIKHSSMASILILFLLSFFGTAKAQETKSISLVQAIDSAQKNSLLLKKEDLLADYHQKLIKSGVDIPQTNLLFEAGQFNSIYGDTRISLSQSIKFPSIYSRQKDVLKAQWENSIYDKSLRNNEIKNNISELFYYIIFLREKKKLLLEYDSLYSEFIKKTDLRLSLGESNVLEKKNALIQQGQIVSQIIEIESTLTAALSTFNWMLQTENLYEPQADFYTKILVPTDSILPQNHPLLLKQLHQETIASAGIALEKAKLLPDFLLSYNNQSIQGTGADNNTYNAGKRFHSIQAGIGIPISNSAQKARVNAAKTEVLIAQNNTEISIMELQNTINNTRISYDKQLSLVKYFEENALPQIYEIQKVADLQFNAGEINYLEWMMLTHQAVQTRSDYLEALRQLNHYSLQIQQLLQF